MAKFLVVDLDGTLTIDAPNVPYADKEPNRELISKLAFYKENGFRITISTSRNVRTYGGNVGLINIHTLPTILEWLARHNVPFDEVVVGKPWCGDDGFYIDDRAVRPDEFIKYDYEMLRRLTLGELEG